MHEVTWEQTHGEAIASALQDTDAPLRRLLQDTREEVLQDEAMLLPGRVPGITFNGIAEELNNIAAFRSAWLKRSGKLPDDIEETILQRVEALASAASLCEAGTITDAYLLITFADYLIDSSIGFRGALDLPRFQLGQRLLQSAMLGLRRQGAAAQHRPDLTDSFCSHAVGQQRSE